MGLFTQGAGGKFTGSQGGGGAAPPPWLGAIYGRLGIKPGSLAYDPKGKHGTGYGHKAGDPRVKRAQQALNAWLAAHGGGTPLAEDGKLGPKTTAVIKKWQRANHMPANGVLTPDALATLVKSAPAPKAAPKKTARSMMHRASRPAHHSTSHRKAKPKAKPAPITRNTASATRIRGD